MTRGIAQLHLPAGARVSAPRSGLYLGASSGTGVTLRLFRHSGTRLVAVSALAPVQLLALRAASAGVPVRVITTRPGLWQHLLAHGSDAGAVPPGTELVAPAGPSLVIDNHPDETGQLGDAAPWRCRIEVRSPATVADLRMLVHADVMLIGRMLPELAIAATSSFGVPVPNLAQLTTPAPGTVSALHRGAMDSVQLDVTEDEAQLLSSPG